MADKISQSQVISKNIKELREKMGWNQSKLASEAGITAAALSKIEKGDGRLPTIVVLRKLASALKVQPYEITDEEPINTNEAETCNRAFYRKWDILDSLSRADQDMLKGMAERLKQITDD
jgi:transcriptional regulator with XRE-family HTH domain